MGCYSERKDYKRAIKVLEDYIDKSPHQGYLYYAYHNLAHCFYLNEKYNESLQMISNAFGCQVDKSEMSVTQLLEGIVYVALGEIDKAIYCFEECKEGIKLHIQKQFLDEWYEETIKLFFSLGEYHNVKLLLEEVKYLVNSGEFPAIVFKDLKLQLVEYALGIDPLSFGKLEILSL